MEKSKSKSKFLEKNFEKYLKKKLSFHEFLRICHTHKEIDELFCRENILETLFESESYNELYSEFKTRGRTNLFFEVFNKNLDSEKRLIEKIKFCSDFLNDNRKSEELELFLDDVVATEFLIKNCFSEFLSAMSNSAELYFKLFLDILSKHRDILDSKTRVQNVHEVCSKLNSLVDFLEFLEFSIGIDAFKNFEFLTEDLMKFEKFFIEQLHVPESADTVYNLIETVTGDQSSTSAHCRIYIYIRDKFKENSEELFEILRSSENSREKLIEIFRNNLEDQYSTLEAFKSFVRKESQKRKNKLNL